MRLIREDYFKFYVKSISRIFSDLITVLTTYIPLVGCAFLQTNMRNLDCAYSLGPYFLQTICYGVSRSTWITQIN